MKMVLLSMKIIPLSYTAVDIFTASDRVPAVQAVAKNTAQNFSFSSFMSMLGLSSVIQKSIESYYPVKDENGLNSYETMFNSTILPRESSCYACDKIHIFRCAAMPLDFVFKKSISDQKNHYVPLVPEYCLDLKVKVSKSDVVLHFNHNNTIPDKNSLLFNKCHKIQPLIDHFCQVFQEYALPETHMAIDEQMVPFKGHHTTKHYLP